MTQAHYPLNSQVLAIFILSATIPTTPHYPEFTDRHSPQYGKLSFSLHFMTCDTFFDFPSNTSTSFLNHMASPIPGTPPSPTPLTPLSHLPSVILLI